MKSISIILFAAATMAAVANCSSFNPELGDAPYLCSAAAPDCPEGYTCQVTQQPAPKDMACLREGGTLPDAGSGGGFQCADDGQLEPNETVADAHVTDVGTAMTRTFGPISICPDGDKDLFQINTTAINQGIEVISTWETGMQVNVAILNASGSSINNGIAMGTNAMRACVANLPMGSYYAAASAAAGVKNNYRLSLKIVAACQ